MLDHAGFFRIFWEHSRRAPGRRARGPATTPDFRPFCARGLSQRCRLRHDGKVSSAARSPRTDAGLVQGATDGRHGRHRAKGCPQIGSQHMRQGYTHPLQGLLRRRLWPERATQHFVSARAYSAASGADTSDSLRCDARSTRARRRTTATTPHTSGAPYACAQFGYAPRVADQRRRCGCCKQALGVVAPAPASAFA